MAENRTAHHRLPRGRLRSVAVLAAAAVLLSTGTILGLRWAVTPRAGAAKSAEHPGFFRLHRPAPGVRLPDLSGHATVGLAGLAGRPIVLNFWQSTCPPCRREAPALAHFASTMAGQVSFLGIDELDSRSPAAAFAARYGIGYQSGYDPAGTETARYGVVALPSTFFLSRSGRTILGENIGVLTPRRLRTILRKLYGVT